MAACAVLAALWPLLRPSPPMKADAAANEAAFYKAQLEEIRRDVERGLLPQAEAESARAEAARRLIASASEPSEAQPPARRTRLAAAALIAVGLPAIAFPLYAHLGEPMLPDEPLASRKVTPQTDGGIEAAVAAVESRLTAKPGDGRGWAVIRRFTCASSAIPARPTPTPRRCASSAKTIAALGLWGGSGRRRRGRGH
jgi:cytochrome c-type biogenesis protein CcmH